MNILLIGSGGREHALAHIISKSAKCDQLFIAPGNPGTADLGKNVALSTTDFDSLKSFILENNISILVIGPEDPLVNGMADFVKGDTDIKDVIVVGPQKAGAMLEGSKDFSKAFMAKHNIPTAAYQTFDASNLEEGYAFLETLKPPYVLKADGLAAGKGVLIPETLEQAKADLKEMIADSKFGDASAKVVIEEFLTGVEISVFGLLDGEGYVVLGNAKDYKRIGEGDTGLNTGGMGCVSPVPFASAEFMQKVEDQVIKPTVEGLKKDGITYQGFCYFGLMNVDGEPKVIEYNVRMGDPETQIIMPRIKNDIIDLFEAIGTQTLNDQTVEHIEEHAATVIMVSGGYPEAYPKGKVITGIENATSSTVYHAGTKMDGENLVSNGGRVLAITSLGNDIWDALNTSYESVKAIDFDGAYYRTDLGNDLKKFVEKV